MVGDGIVDHVAAGLRGQPEPGAVDRDQPQPARPARRDEDARQMAAIDQRVEHDDRHPVHRTVILDRDSVRTPPPPDEAQRCQGAARCNDFHVGRCSRPRQRIEFGDHPAECCSTLHPAAFVDELEVGLGGMTRNPEQRRRRGPRRTDRDQLRQPRLPRRQVISIGERLPRRAVRAIRRTRARPAAGRTRAGAARRSSPLPPLWCRARSRSRPPPLPPRRAGPLPGLAPPRAALPPGSAATARAAASSRCRRLNARRSRVVSQFEI